INDDDGTPTLAINDVAVTEGNSGTVNAVFAVTLSAASGQTVTVNYTTADGSATAGIDYVSASGLLSFQPGETSQPVIMVVNGDGIDEPNETFFVNLSNAVNATIGDNQGTGTISNDDGAQPPVTVSFQDGVGGYTGTRDTKLVSGSPTTNYGTASGLEMDGSPDLSSLVSWDLTSIPSGSIIQSVDVTVDVTNTSTQNYEFYEMKRPWIESAATWNEYASGLSWEVMGADGSGDRGTTVVGALTATSRGLQTISLNASGVAVVQSWVDNPSSNHGFIILNYISATDGLKFSSRENGTASNCPKLTVTYGGSGSPPLPSLAINDVALTEGNSGTVNAVFAVTLSAASSQTVTVNYATANGSATAGSDYVTVSGQVTFQPGETSQSVTVVVNGDVLDEPNETFVVNLSNAVNATIGDNQGTGTINDDDGAPSLAINDVAVTEGNSGTVNAVFAVTLSGTSSQTVTVNYATADGTATTAGNDYVAASGQVSFSPGQTSQPVTVVVNGDLLEEPNATFLVNLSNAVNATIGDNQGIGTITNDDGGQQLETVSFQDGVNGYTGTRDTKLLSGTPTTNYGTSDKLELDGSPDVSSLLSWDLTSIPAGSIIQSVDITVNVTNTSTNNYEFYEMKRPWVEGAATWNEYAFGLGWEVAGADGSGDRGTTVLGAITAATTGLQTFSLNASGVAMVQSWVDNPATNHGFAILDYINASNGLDFSSRENGTVSNCPKLTVTYSGGSQPKLAVPPRSESDATALSTETLPQTITLNPSYPNPFNLETRIEYALPKPGRVSLVIYNVRGQQVRKLVDEIQSGGFKRVLWNGRDDFGQGVGSGVYLIRLVVGQQRFVGKLLLQK
ncbi:DNRLRE domain-containing protein, partial [candidate division KSB1 bacterium]|nr:DNRLRE domain-containing protein [candidate division KSB1 bacterium]